MNRFWLAAVVFVSACHRDEPNEPALVFAHSLLQEQGARFGDILQRNGITVSLRSLPFSRARQTLLSLDSQSPNCPDIVRIDSTWFAQLQAKQKLAPSPIPIPAELDWSKQSLAAALSIDGLVVVRSANTAAASPATVNDWLRGVGKLSAHPDGYWAIAWLRSADIALAAPPVDGGTQLEQRLATALAHFAAVTTAADQRYSLRGSWELASDEFERVQSLPGAPKGLQLLVVPTCSQRRDQAWQAVLAMTSQNVARELSTELGWVPVRSDAIDKTMSTLAAAIAANSELPATTVVPALFDDLTPAVQAVVNGDATSTEAAQALARGWQQLSQPTKALP